VALLCSGALCAGRQEKRLRKSWGRAENGRDKRTKPAKKSMVG